MPYRTVVPALKCATVVLTIAAVSLSPCRVLAWSAEGHEAVALIAEAQLKSAGQFGRVSSLLGNLSLEDIATCPDQVRELERDSNFHLTPACQQVFPDPPKGTSNWHFVNIPVTISNPTDTQITAACGKACAVTEIQHFGAVLADTTQSNAVRLQALSFVVHFIGDIHQPLHTAVRGKDAGGNAEQIRIDNHKMALHHAWDEPLVSDIDADPSGLATNLQPEITQAAQEPKVQLNDWVRQSFGDAGSIAYKGVPPAKGKQVVATLNAGYVSAATPVVRLQIARAGVRLSDFIIAHTPQPAAAPVF